MKKMLVFLLGTFFMSVSQAALYQLSADLRPPNQNGTDPDRITDPQGIVPSSASGAFSAILDTEALTLTDIVLSVEGMTKADLLNFGPNATPFHLHIPNSGPGSFGFNVVDLSFGPDAGHFITSATGFTYVRGYHSIKGDAQGQFVAAGIFPGDDVIADLLIDESFILVHSNKELFTNTVHPPQFPDGFPVW